MDSISNLNLHLNLKNIANREKDEDFYDAVISVLDIINDKVVIVSLPFKIEFINKAAKSTCQSMDICFDVLKPIISKITSDQKVGLLLELNGQRLVFQAMPFHEKKILITAHDITMIDRLQTKLELKEQIERFHSQEITGLRQKLLKKNEMVVVSKAMEDIMDLISRIAQVESTVLILGESGVGKDVIAHKIHDMSNRHMAPFIKIDCGNIPENLVESELFGYDEGAFTGAKKGGKSGLIELANGGTLFLDEVGELPLSMQVKLLRVLQEYRVQRVGGTEAIPIDVRIISATNRNLEEMVKEGLFRLDLYYRLNVVPIKIPPLRERAEEIPELIKYFLNKLKNKYQKDKSISHEVLKVFLHYSWPGNIRELENMVERLFVISKENIISIDNIPDHFQKCKTTNQDIIVNNVISIKEAIKIVESELIKMALEEFKTTPKIGKALGIDQSTAVRKIQKYFPNYGNSHRYM